MSASRHGPKNRDIGNMKYNNQHMVQQGQLAGVAGERVQDKIWQQL